MALPGFYITRLTLTGAAVPNAEVRFSEGLNVISGPSDTGKTYIIQCIDFMLGGRDAPKAIPEASVYELVELGICRRDEAKEIVLTRRIQGGRVYVRELGQRGRSLSARHRDGDENTLSHYLLTLCGLSGKKVRKNRRGQTRGLSFRDLARLIVVDEESIISQRSPIFSGQYTSKTVENSVFRLVLSGLDDSAIQETEDPTVTRGRQTGKREVLELLIARDKEKLVQLNIPGETRDWQANLERTELTLDRTRVELGTEQHNIAAREEERRVVWLELLELESKLDIVTELDKRFDLLQQQYASDFARLVSIAEASTRLGQTTAENCPVCGSPAEYHDQSHQETAPNPEDIATACGVEADKIKTLLSDLESTKRENSLHIRRLDAELNEQRFRLRLVDTELREELKPKVDAAIQLYNNNQSLSINYRRALELQRGIIEMEALLSENVGVANPTRDDASLIAIDTQHLELFSKQIESILIDWHFPHLDRVTFSETDQDIVISGRRRVSHGKGVRAITHAAFNLGILSYCLDRSMPHPGVVCIDSPLVVYEEPDPEEISFPHDLRDSFYEMLVSTYSDSQIIVCENVSAGPPQAVDLIANHIKFTGTDQGRQGFIPTTLAVA